MPKRPSFAIFLSIFLLSIITHAQNTITLRGRVVEIIDGKQVGVAGVTVSVSGESYDVTAQDGSFKLYAPTTIDQVTITLRGTNNLMISPYEGRVNLPPNTDPIEIKTCAEKNAELIKKVVSLQAKLKTSEQEKKLSKRQLEAMQKTMIDTIESYMNTIASMRVKLAKSDSTGMVANTRIRILENRNRQLEERLFAALEEKFLKQHEFFEEISSGLNNYRSRLKDIQKGLLLDPAACASAVPQACERFYASIEKYNSSRNTLYENLESHQTAASHYWSDSNIAEELKNTYSYIFEKIHDPLLFNQMNETIINPLKMRSSGKLSKKAAKKTIDLNTSSINKTVVPLISQLDIKIDHLLQLLSNHIL